MKPTKEQILGTIQTLRQCQAARAQGYPVSYTYDSAWLVQMAINRRAGWPDDTSLSRGSAMPVNGRYPNKAEGDGAYRHLEQLARDINTPRLIVRPGQLGTWRKLIMARIPNRITQPWEE